MKVLNWLVGIFSAGLIVFGLICTVVEPKPWAACVYAACCFLNFVWLSRSLALAGRMKRGEL